MLEGLLLEELEKLQSSAGTRQFRVRVTSGVVVVMFEAPRLFSNVNAISCLCGR